MTEEHRIQNEIRLALADSCMIFRINVGKGYTPDRRYFDTGVPKGFSDLFGFRKSDGKAVFIEVKTPTGRSSKQQLNFLHAMQKYGAIAGICRSTEDAIKLIKESKKMGFSTDYEEVNDFSILPEGSYECIIAGVAERTTKKGATGLNVNFVVRNDVEQQYKNRHIFYTRWKRKEPTARDMQVQGYGFKQIMALAKATKLPSGKTYETVYDLCQDLNQRTCTVELNHREYNGKPQENVQAVSETKFPDCKHVFKEKATVTADTVAQPKNDSFASAQTVDGYEEILSDDVVPF